MTVCPSSNISECLYSYFVFRPGKRFFVKFSKSHISGPYNQHKYSDLNNYLGKFEVRYVQIFSAKNPIVKFVQVGTRFRAVDGGYSREKEINCSLPVVC